jgi:hypothetical protein
LADILFGFILSARVRCCGNGPAHIASNLFGVGADGFFWDRIGSINIAQFTG